MRERNLAKVISSDTAAMVIMNQTPNLSKRNLVTIASDFLVVPSRQYQF